MYLYYKCNIVLVTVIIIKWQVWVTGKYLTGSFPLPPKRGDLYIKFFSKFILIFAKL